MFATADCTNHYPEQTVYDSEWTENTPSGISWMSLLTSQSIPEEPDNIDEASVRSLRKSHCSSSSSSSSTTTTESCYVVLEIQRNRSSDETPSQVEENTEAAVEYEEENDVTKQEDAEEQEEIEIEELNFAQVTKDDHSIHYEQFAETMTTEIPSKEYTVNCKEEQVLTVTEYVQVTQPIIQETPNDILFDKAKTLCKFTKRIKAKAYATVKEENPSASSDDDESMNITKLKTIRQVNEYYPTTISSVSSEHQSTVQNSESFRHSTTSLDSIENQPLSSSPSVPTRLKTTFSNLSTLRASNPSNQVSRTGPAMGTTTLTRTFAFDRACMEKYGRNQGQENVPVQVSLTPNNQTKNKENIELPEQKKEHAESYQPVDNKLHCRSFTNTIPAPFYMDREASINDDSDFDKMSSIPSTPISNSLSKASSILCLMKKYVQTVKSDYRFTLHKSKESILSEPTLLQVKYLDGRNPLRDGQERESFQQDQLVNDSISNRLGLQNRSSSSKLSSSTASFMGSYRKRMFSRFRTFVENYSLETQQPPLPHAVPWQHKNVSELFHHKKYKLNHRQ